jgi:hypothetical protein
MKNNLTAFIAILFFTISCAGTQRDCSSQCASELGSDWIIVQYGVDGKPFNCWRLEAAAISNEHGTDGIFWQNSDGHLVHISGWYNRVQVEHRNWKSAAQTIGIDLDSCKDGAYALTSDAGAPDGL